MAQVCHFATESILFIHWPNADIGIIRPSQLIMLLLAWEESLSKSHVSLQSLKSLRSLKSLKLRSKSHRSLQSRMIRVSDSMLWSILRSFLQERHGENVYERRRGEPLSVAYADQWNISRKTAARHGLQRSRIHPYPHPLKTRKSRLDPHLNFHDEKPQNHRN